MSNLKTWIFFLISTAFISTACYVCCQADDASPHPWSLEFRDPSQEAVIKESGQITVKRSSELLKDLLKESDLVELFKLAAQPSFQHSPKEYLAAEGSFVNSKFYYKVQLILKDATGEFIHQVTYDLESKKSMPQSIKEMVVTIQRIINTNFPLPGKCGYRGPSSRHNIKNAL